MLTYFSIGSSFFYNFNPIRIIIFTNKISRFITVFVILLIVAFTVRVMIGFTQSDEDQFDASHFTIYPDKESTDVE